MHESPSSQDIDIGDDHLNLKFVVRLDLNELRENDELNSFDCLAKAFTRMLHERN
jgi:hypothetical protein